MERAVVVCNAFPDDNKGGSVITQQTIEWLKGVYPERALYIVPVEQSGDHDIRRFRFTLRRHPEVRILRSPIRTDGAFLTTCRMLIRSFALLWGPHGATPFECTIADAEVVVSKGGYVFVERDSLGGLLGLWFTAFPLILASRRGVPTVVLCTTVGPYRTGMSRRLCRWILKDVGLVVTRDPLSTIEARRLGCGVVKEIPDIAWTFDEDRVGRASPASQHQGRFGVVVLSPETPELDAVFLDRLGQLCSRLLDGRIERLIVAIQSREDLPISRRLVGALDDPRVELLDEDLAPEELMALYRKAEFLIGRRLHAGVFALIVGTPVVLFSTDGVKADGVMQELGLGDRVFRYPDFSIEEVDRCIVKATSGVDERARVREVVRAARARVTTGLDSVAQALRNGRPREGGPSARRERLGA